MIIDLPANAKVVTNLCNLHLRYFDFLGVLTEDGRVLVYGTYDCMVTVTKNAYKIHIGSVVLMRKAR